LTLPVATNVSGLTAWLAAGLAEAVPLATKAPTMSANTAKMPIFVRCPDTLSRLPLQRGDALQRVHIAVSGPRTHHYEPITGVENALAW
jgi:hypothetical protein